MTQPDDGDAADRDARSGGEPVSPSPAAEELLDQEGADLRAALSGDDDYADELPEDLDVSEFVGPYTFPNNNRRRIPAAIYLVLGAACVVLFALNDTDSALINTGTLWAGVGLIAFGAYGMIAGWTLTVEESDALATASGTVGFAVGHASAQMAWRGWLSRPTWRILCYSAENPPKQRGIVLVDGVSGEVIEWFAEENPEDWSQLDGSLTA
ncbi:hypothetical protein [Dermatobacter hominis]|uniref:hypothetical protein n=1 Tax=Dermatobacter hominis TaxID=2884263 RepID=UPI001D100134|nr:hypothetical protein [Dermatobacter hominis]UDY36144.1 hypothetical protein LH044_01080 [Dermatobacter hominis]